MITSCKCWSVKVKSKIASSLTCLSTDQKNDIALYTGCIESCPYPHCEASLSCGMLSLFYSTSLQLVVFIMKSANLWKILFPPLSTLSSGDLWEREILSNGTTLHTIPRLCMWIIKCNFTCRLVMRKLTTWNLGWTFWQQLDVSWCRPVVVCVPVILKVVLPVCQRPWVDLTTNIN